MKMVPPPMVFWQKVALKTSLVLSRNETSVALAPEMATEEAMTEDIY